MIKLLRTSLLLFLSFSTFAQVSNKFEQLGPLLPTPNLYRTAAGAPGHGYYQQKANYEIDVTLDDAKQRIEGKERITYINNSPDVLEYLWLQLDQNMRAQGSDRQKLNTASFRQGTTSFDDILRLHNDFEGGFNIGGLTDDEGSNLKFTIIGTMMRVHIPAPMQPGDSYSFKVSYDYNINNRMEIGGRSGYEHFEEEDNYLYTIAQFFPRMCVYNDVEGWQNKQFLGRGEFTLPFGDYDVNITVPSDHVVGATGVLQNATDILTETQLERYEQAKTADKPVMIVNPKEAAKAEKKKASGTKTWSFHADNVRDFAFASSRKFIWDAMGVNIGDKTIMAMSYYPKEGNPLWEQYSTEVVAHTIRVYSKYTIDYNYPVAISVHTNRIGMEYPMICFNGGRPEADGTYSERTKYGMISVIIHEVGHNFFPMIINSDERQWTWMDEGLNTFVQYLTEKEWDRDYPCRRGPANKITDYMKGDPRNISPIMTNSEQIFQFGNNAYGKPATALNILRETILGRENFDFAFKTYCERWAFKHPTPADFFRTMEDASGVDLDWYWRGWFYGTKAVDLGIADVQFYQLSTQNPDKENPLEQKRLDELPVHIGDIRNKEDIPSSMLDQKPELNDFYNSYDPLAVTKKDREEYEKFLKRLDDKQKAILNADWNYYEVRFTNKGGLPMPIILDFEFSDGSTEHHYIPAEIWRFGKDTVSKIFYTKKSLVSATLDPNLETADINMKNNVWPKRMSPTRFELFMREERDRKNPMQRR